MVDFIPNLFNIIQVVRASMRAQQCNCCWQYSLHIKLVWKPSDLQYSFDIIKLTNNWNAQLSTDSTIYFTAKNRVQMSEIIGWKNFVMRLFRSNLLPTANGLSEKIPNYKKKTFVIGLLFVLLCACKLLYFLQRKIPLTFTKVMSCSVKFSKV